MTDPDTLLIRYARALGVAEGALMIIRTMRKQDEELVSYVDKALAQVEATYQGTAND